MGHALPISSEDDFIESEIIRPVKRNIFGQETFNLKSPTKTKAQLEREAENYRKSGFKVSMTGLTDHYYARPQQGLGF